MLPLRPLRLDVYEPRPLPSLVAAFAKVGRGEVLYTTPRAVTVAPPSLVTLPPVIAEVPVMLLAGVVDTTG